MTSVLKTASHSKHSSFTTTSRLDCQTSSEKRRNYRHTLSALLYARLHSSPTRESIVNMHIGNYKLSHLVAPLCDGDIPCFSSADAAAPAMAALRRRQPPLR